MKRILATSVLVSLFCISSAQADDHSEIEKQYPKDRYFVGLGIARDDNKTRALQAATDEARSELAKNIKATIKAESISKKKASQEFSDGHKLAEKVVKTFSQENKVTSSLSDMTGVQTGSAEYDHGTKTANVLVFLDRFKFSESAKGKLVDSGETIKTYTASAKNESKTLRRIHFYKKALVELEKIKGTVDIYDAVAPDGWPKSRELMGISEAELTTLLVTEIASLKLKIATSGEQDLAGVLVGGLNKSGFKVVDSSEVVLKINVTAKITGDKLLATAGIEHAAGTIVTDLYEKDERVGSFFMEATGAGNSEDAARDDLKRELRGIAETQYVDELIRNF